VGWTLDGVEFEFEGELTDADAEGNNVAWNCPASNRSILFVYQRGRPGSSRRTPATCRGCQRRFLLWPEYPPGPEPRARTQPSPRM